MPPHEIPAAAPFPAVSKTRRGVLMPALLLVAALLAAAYGLTAGWRAGTAAPASPPRAATVPDGLAAVPPGPTRTAYPSPVPTAAVRTSVRADRVSASASTRTPPSVTGSPSPAKTPGRANPTGANLALNAKVTASSIEGSAWQADQATDGDRSTRWSSGFADPQWIRLDLGGTWRITQVRLLWENSYAVACRVETSVDGTSWSPLWATKNGTGGTVSIRNSGVAARYVRMYGTKRNTAYGYSLFEFEVR